MKKLIERTFSKVKAVFVSAVLVAGGAGVTELGGVDWDEVFVDLPGPDYLKVAAGVLAIGLVNTAAGYFKRERRGQYPAEKPKLL